MQSKALGRLQKYMEKTEKVAIINSFIHANFNYCPLVWYFSICESIRKIEKVQKRCLRIVLDDYDSNYDVSLRKLLNFMLMVAIFHHLNCLTAIYVTDANVLR